MITLVRQLFPSDRVLRREFLCDDHGTSPLAMHPWTQGNSIHIPVCHRCGAKAARRCVIAAARKPLAGVSSLRRESRSARTD